jgi:hypothetical protein
MGRIDLSPGAGGSGPGGPTNLSPGTPSPNSFVIANSNGTGVTIPEATTAAAGVMGTDQLAALTAAEFEAFNTSSSGVFTGGTITIASSTTFNISAMQGVVCSAYPATATPIAYAGATGLTTPYISSDKATYLLIDNTGALIMQNSYPSVLQRRSKIFLGYLIHSSSTLILAENTPDIASAPGNVWRDSGQVQKFACSGITFQGRTVGSLDLKSSTAFMFGVGINFTVLAASPNNSVVGGNSPCTLRYRTVTAVATATVGLVDPGHYDSAGAVTAISGTQYSNQRIYLTSDGRYFVSYGQTLYASMDAAASGAMYENIGESILNGTDLIQNLILVGVMTLMSTATDLTSATQCRFLAVDKFGNILGDRERDRAIIDSLGDSVNADGTFHVAAFSATNYLAASTSETDALIRLDTALHAGVGGGSSGLTGATYNGSNQLTAYSLNGVNYTLTYTSTTIVQSGSDGTTVTINLDGAGRIQSVV